MTKPQWHTQALRRHAIVSIHNKDYVVELTYRHYGSNQGWHWSISDPAKPKTVKPIESGHTSSEDQSHLAIQYAIESIEAMMW